MHWSVVGHESQKKLLESALRTGALPSVNIYYGPSGIGKRLFAFDVIRKQLGTLFEVSHHPDVFIVQPIRDEQSDGYSEITVADIRDAKIWAYQRPLYGEQKILFIDNAHVMSDEAANALLKLLEEPPAYLISFLITSMPDALLATVRSRSQTLAFFPLDTRDIAKILHKGKMSDADVTLLQLVAHGIPGLALEYSTRNRLTDIARSLKGFQRFCSLSYGERLVLTKQLADEETLSEQVQWWLLFVRRELSSKPALLPAAEKLLDLVVTLSEAKHNRRIALDAFALELPHYSW